MKQNNDKPTIKEDLICYKEIIMILLELRKKMILKNCDHMCLWSVLFQNVVVVTRSKESCFTNFEYSHAAS